MSSDLRQYPPTARRLARLRQAGIFPYSRVLSTAVIFGGLVLIVAALSSVLLAALQRPLAHLLSNVSATEPFAMLTSPTVIWTGLIAGGLLVFIWLLAVGITALQRGSSPGGGGVGQLPGSPSRISWQRSRTADLAWELIVSATILGGAAIIIYGRLPTIAQMPPLQPEALGGYLAQIVWAFAWRFTALLLGLGICDYLYQQAMFGQAAAMSHPEIQQEIRETEGPWLVRWWQQRRMRER